MAAVDEKLISKCADALKKHNMKVVTAESCTGGGISYYLTQLAGSSSWFDRGFVTYSNEAKMAMLGVRLETLEAYGAVSKETAIEMAEGALTNSLADISIAVTGIAGPDGGSKEKPVGTVWIAWAKKRSISEAKLFTFSGSREEIRIQSIEKALTNLLNFL